MADLTITADLLTRAAKRNGYAIPTDGLVFFGIRGLKPELPFENRFSTSRTGRFGSIDFLRMNCTIGQWKVASDEIALFPGSTVPSLPNIERAKSQGGTGTNLLMLGRYEHEKGMHKPSKTSGHRAFRQATFFPVWRTVNDLNFDLADKMDFGSGPGDFVWDNLHSAYSDNLGKYSSAGCQVVCGLPKSQDRGNQRETGPWRTFIDNAYDIDQERFVYLLFSADELALLEKAGNLTQVVRFGSSGPLAKEVQTKLRAQDLLTEKADGEFGRESLRALMAFQAKSIGPSAADGVCGADTAKLLGVTLPSLTKAKPAPQPGQQSGSTVDNPDLEDETDLDEETVRQLLAAALGLFGTQPILSATTETGATHMTMSETDTDRSRANFERAQALIKEFEGGFSNNPKDPGGPTNFGITHRTLAAWRHQKSVTVDEVRNMTYAEAKDIYYSEYWSKCSCGLMPGPLALPVYNLAVHGGPGMAGDFLQRALNRHGASLKVDKRIGEKTLAAVSTAPLSETIDTLIDLYEAKLKAHKDFATFGKGFLRRTNVLRSEAKKWLAEAPSIETTGRPTGKLVEEGVPTVTNEELIAAIAAALNINPAQPGNPHQPGVASPGSANPQDQTSALVATLRTLLQSATGKPGLTPVNGALGTTIGNMLDGRKSFLGILGSVLSSLLSTGSPLLALIPALGPIAPIASALLPLFLGLAAWGGLGKMDKYAAQQK